MKTNITTTRKSIHDQDTARVPANQAQLARHLMRERNSQFYKAQTEPLEKVRGYDREEMYKIVTAPMPATSPYHTVNMGTDTCDKLELVFQWSGAKGFVWVFDVGFCQIKAIRQKDRGTALILTVDILGHEKWVPISWYSEIHLFLGSP